MVGYAKQDYSNIITNILNSDTSIPFQEIEQGTTSQVYFVDLEDPLIVKMNLVREIEEYQNFGEVIPNRDIEYLDKLSELFDKISIPEEITPRILHFEKRETDGLKYLIQVQTFIPGQPTGYLLAQEKEAMTVVNAVFALHQRLKSVSPLFSMDIFGSLEGIMNLMAQSEEDLVISSRTRALLSSPHFKRIMNSEPHILIDHDVNINNILITRPDNVVRKVDITLTYGPPIYQAGSFFFTYFMLNELENFDFDRALRYWPDKSITKEDLILMMQPFALLFAFFFGGITRKSEEITAESKAMIAAYREQIIIKCLDHLEKQLG